MIVIFNNCFSISRELRHNRHIVLLLTDRMVCSHKYRGKILTGDIAMLAEAIEQNPR